MNTSVILLVAVTLWLVWVGPYVLRRQKPIPLADSPAAIPEQAITFEVAPAPRPDVFMAMETPPTQETQMKNTGTSHAPSAGAARPSAARPARLNIRYGRTAVALIGVLALLTVVIGGGLKLLGLASGLIPAAAGVVFFASLGLLRVLAIRSRRRKVQAAFRAAMGSSEAPARPASAVTAGQPDGAVTAVRPASERRAVAVFDAAADAAATEAAPARKPLTAAELRRAALEVAARGAADAEVAHTHVVAESPTWEPVEIPAPGYVQARKADRPAPEPLDLPAAPKPAAKTSIKATEAAAASVKPSAGPATADPSGEQAAAKLSAGQKADGAVVVPAPVVPAKTKPVHGLSNLDDVLQRRRA